MGYVEGRCRGVNLCDYCAIQAAHENARMLGLAAIENPDPQLLAIVGTGLPTTDPRPFYYGRQQVVRSLRGEFGRQVEYASLQEFTTGKGTRSGGLRRPHWNLFFRGLDEQLLDQVRDVVREMWCANVPDAQPEAQYVEILRHPGAAANYVAKHFHKRDQQPPRGWRGQRFNCSRGYFDPQTRAEARETARASLALDRAIWRVRRDCPELDGADVLEIAEQLLELDAQKSWSLRQVSPVAAERILRACSGLVPPAQTAPTPAV